MRRPRSRSAAVLLALALCTCTDAPTGLHGLGHLSLTPTYTREAHEIAQSLAAVGLTIDKVFVEVRGPAGDVRTSQVVDFPADQTQTKLTVQVRLNAGREQLTAALELRSGARPIFASATPVTVRQSQTTLAQSTPMTYVGPGAAATLLKVQPPQATIGQTATQQFTPAAFAANQSAVSDLPITGWTSSDPKVATVNDAGLVQGVKSGTVTVTARALNLLVGTATLHVVGLPARLAVITGGSQSATVGATLAQQFQIQVLSDAGEGVPGVTVNFQAVTAGALVGSATVTTDVQGLASTTVTLGTAAGPYEFRASVAGATSGLQPATITALAQAGAAAFITKVSGDAQNGTSGQPVGAPLVVRVTDAYGNPVAGVTVTFTRLTGSGALSTSRVTTGADGLASTGYTLGTIAGTESIRADVTGLTGVGATFNLTSSAGAPTALAPISAEVQHVTVGAALGAPLVALVTDTHGNPVPGVTVGWTIVSGAGSLSTDHSVTNAAGEASIGFTADGHAGTTVIRATVGESSHNFTVVSDAGAPSQLTITASADNQSVPAGTSVPIAPSVIVTDSHGNPVAGVSVTFTPASGSGSVVGATQTTNANGLAAVGGWTLGEGAGKQTLTVTAGQLSGSVTATALPTLTTTVTGNGAGTIVSQPSGVSCALVSGSTTGVCSFVFPLNQVVTLSAAPASNSNFAGFTGACAGKSACSVTMSESKTIGATFSLVPRTLTVSGGAGNGVITSSPDGISCVITSGVPADHGCTAQFLDGTQVMLSVSPAAGFKFVNWAGACSASGGCSVTMAGDQTVRATFSLGTWTTMSIPTTALLHGIWGSSPKNIFAVGAGGTILRYDGYSWTSLGSDAITSNLWDVWGTGYSMDVYAASQLSSGRAQLAHYDGSSWSAMSVDVPACNLYGVWGTSGSNVYVVGEKGTFLRFDGSKWTSFPTGTTSDLLGIWGSGPNDVYIVGFNGTALHYDGYTVSAIPLPDLKTESIGAVEALGAVWGSSASDIWIGGGLSTSDLWHFGGSTWTKSNVGNLTGSLGAGVNGIWGMSSSDVWAVGAFGAYHYDGSTWSPATVNQAGITLLRVWGSGSLDVFATGLLGGSGVILHYQ